MANLMSIATKTLSIKELKLLDLVQTGEGGQMAGCDRRTFMDWANRLNISPVATLKGNKALYKREDAERIARAYKAFQKEKQVDK